jgi:hypothetical protein
MHWTAWTIVALSLLLGGWMSFDGVRALTLGDYVTPRSGEYAGRLGPWANLLQGVGIEPRSTGVKVAHVAIGVAWLAAAVCVIANVSTWRWVVAACSIASLWYLPFGTLIGIANVVLLGLKRP